MEGVPRIILAQATTTSCENSLQTVKKGPNEVIERVVKCATPSTCKWCPLAMILTKPATVDVQNCYETCQFKYTKNTKDMHRRHRSWFCKRYNNGLSCILCSERFSDGYRIIDHLIQCRCTELKPTIFDGDAFVEFIVPLYTPGWFHYSFYIKGLMFYLRIDYTSDSFEVKLISDTDDRGWQFLNVLVSLTVYASQLKITEEKYCDEVIDEWDWRKSFDNRTMRMNEGTFCETKLKISMKNKSN